MSPHDYRYRQMRIGSEEIVSVGFSKASSFQPPTTATATRSAFTPNRTTTDQYRQQQHRQQQQQQRMRQQQQEEERRAPTPRTTNGRIRAMAQKLENASSSNKEDALPKMKSSVAYGNNLAERKRQLGFLTEHEVNAPKAVLMDNRSTSKYRVPSPPKSGSVSSNTSTTSVQNRIVKSRFADKKQMFERAVERNRFHQEVATNSKTGMAQVQSDSDCSPLVYDGSLASDDTATARDEVEARRPCHPRDDREDSQVEQQGRGPCQTAEVSSLMPGPSFEEALGQIVTSFEKDVKASEAAAAAAAVATAPFPFPIPIPMGESTEINASVFDDAPMFFDSWGYVTEEPQLKEFGEASKSIPSEKKCEDKSLPQQNQSRNAAKTERGSPAKTSVSSSKSESDLSPSQLLPGDLLFRTVDQEKHKKKTISHGQDKKPRERAKDLRTATTTTVPMKNAAKSKKATKSERSKTASRSTQYYELLEEEPKKKPSRKSVLRQQHEQPLQTVSTASWYSSENDSSVVSAEISQNLSPLQDPNIHRISVGACVNAHLADNPPVLSEDDESAPTSRHERKGSASSSTMVSMNKLASSKCSMDAQYDGSVQHDAQDLQELAETMTNMANTASNAMLDVLVDAADKVVVSPLISIFHCVDASEHLLCNGSQSMPSVKKLDEKTMERNRRKSRSRSASRIRKSKTQKDRKASLS